MEDQTNNPGNTQPNNSAPQQPQAEPMQQAPSQPLSGAGVVDRSAMQSIYPEVSATHTSNSQVANESINKQIEENYREASSSFMEYVVLVLGLSSATSSLLLASIFKNGTITNIVVATLAIAAIATAIFQYKNTNKTSPITIVGISAATYILVIITRYYFSLWFIKSTVRGLL
jgi:hypothetical protein